MSLKDLLEPFDYTRYYCLVKYGVISTERRSDESVDWIYTSNKLPKFIKDEKRLAKSIAYLQGAYTIGKALQNGQKIFQITCEQAEAFEHTDLNIAVEDYNQPYHTMIIEFPVDYQNKRIKQYVDEYQVRPDHVIIHVDVEKGFIVCCLGMLEDTGRLDQFTTSFVSGRGNTLEEAFEIMCAKVDNLEVGSLLEERKINIRQGWDIKYKNFQYEIITIIRAAMNACLMLDNFGVKRVVVPNEHLLERLRRYATNQNDELKKIKAEVEVRKHPVYYGFKQEVVLYDKDRFDNPSNGNETKLEKDVHWRRGHWRMQAYGPQHTLHKRIRIAPVLVRADLLTGEQRNTETIYRTKV